MTIRMTVATLLLALNAVPAPATAAAVNLALNWPATGSAPCAATEGPEKAVNGSVSGGNRDKWCSTASTKYLQVDLGATASITSFTVRHAGAGGESAAYNTKAFTISLATDASPRRSTSGRCWPGSKRHRARDAVGAAGQARSWRVTW